MKLIEKWLRRGAMCICLLIVLVAFAVLALIEAASYWLDVATEAWDEFIDAWEDV